MMRPAFSLSALCALALILAACGENAAETQQAALRPDAAAADMAAPSPAPSRPAPAPQPPFTGCAVLLGAGTAQLFGVCTAESLQAAIAAPVATPPNARETCTVQIAGGEPVYDGCLDLSGEGLGALTAAARGQ